jgi:hypothetical protein
MGTTLIIIAGLLANGWVLAVVANSVRRARTERRQLELQATLLDRLDSPRDLADFLGTPAGSRFLDATLVGRGQVLWQVVRAVQAGIVLAFPGVACLLLRPMAPEATGELLVAGVLCLSLATGFVASAAVTYRLAHRWDLADTSASD